MAYATKQSVESVLNRSLTSTEEAGLTSLLAAVDSYINSETGRVFETATEQATRYYDGENSRLLDVDPFVADDTHPFEVFYVDADENKTYDVDVSDFEARPRNEVVKTYLQRRNGRWGSGLGNVAVKAHFGSGDVPADIAYAASWLAAQFIGASKSLTLKSENIEGYSRTFADASKTNPVILATFERYHEVLI